MTRWTALLLLVVGLPAQGSLVHVTADAYLYNFDDPHGLLPFSGAAGTPVTLTFTYESTAVDTAPSNPAIGVYESIIDMTLTVGETVIPAFPTRAIQILNDLADPAPAIEVWQASTQFQDGLRRTQYYMALFNLVLCACPESNDLASDALVPPPWPGEWDTADITYTVSEGADPLEQATLARATASIWNVTVVPLPSAAWLFGAGAVVLATRTRRRRLDRS